LILPSERQRAYPYGGKEKAQSEKLCKIKFTRLLPGKRNAPARGLQGKPKVCTKRIRKPKICTKRIRNLS
jgi:hypothetical protein